MNCRDDRGRRNGSSVTQRPPLHLPPLDPTVEGRPVRILSTKYDGSLHYDYRARLVEETAGVLRVVSEVGTPVIGYRGEGALGCSMTQLFFTDRWYNVFHNHEPLGRRRMLSYANIGTPARLEGDTIHWVDLDVDVIQTETQGLVVVDEDEFADHRVRMGYPDDIVARVIEARDELVALGANLSFPFDRETHLP
ncbi:MAG: DUF402 domain-containing protein [Dehalococcoidia bacterium]